MDADLAEVARRQTHKASEHPAQMEALGMPLNRWPPRCARAATRCERAGRPGQHVNGGQSTQRRLPEQLSKSHHRTAGRDGTATCDRLQSARSALAPLSADTPSRNRRAETESRLPRGLRPTLGSAISAACFRSSLRASPSAAVRLIVHRAPSCHLPRIDALRLRLTTHHIATRDGGLFGFRVELPKQCTPRVHPGLPFIRGHGVKYT